MLFNTFRFWLFLAFVFVVHFTLAYRVRRIAVSQLFLLAASIFFYACWNPRYLVLIIISILTTWIGGIAGGHKDWSSGAVPPSKSNTSQAAGYAIDVWRGKVKAERNLLSYALFVTFFPQLVAGPIERTEHLLPQLKRLPKFDYDKAVSVLRLCLWGMVQKVLISDVLLAPYVDKVYGSVSNSSGTALLVATVCFAGQILCEFAGYTDIARGAEWHFVVWGAVHGVCLCIERMLATDKHLVEKSRLWTKYKQSQTVVKVYQTVRVCITFAIVCALWVFFRTARQRTVMLSLPHCLPHCIGHILGSGDSHSTFDGFEHRDADERVPLLSILEVYMNKTAKVFIIKVILSLLPLWAMLLSLWLYVWLCPMKYMDGEYPY